MISQIKWMQFFHRQMVYFRGSGGGQVVSVLAFYPTIRVRIPLKSTIFL